MGREGLDPRRLRGPALLSLALHGSDRPTSVKEIAERTALPQPYLEQILLAVKGAGLVRSKRGVGGGYVLARPPERSRSPRSSPRSTARSPMIGEHDHCEGHCVLQEVWVGVSEETRQVLERVTLADLVDGTRVGHRDGRRGTRSIRAVQDLSSTGPADAHAPRRTRTTTSSPPVASPRARRRRRRRRRACARSRARARSPSGRRRAGSPRQKRSNARARSSAFMPGPSSMTRARPHAARWRHAHRRSRAARRRARCRGGCRRPARCGRASSARGRAGRRRCSKLHVALGGERVPRLDAALDERPSRSARGAAGPSARAS